MTHIKTVLISGREFGLRVRSLKNKWDFSFLAPWGRCFRGKNESLPLDMQEDNFALLQHRLFFFVHLAAIPLIHEDSS